MEEQEQEQVIQEVVEYQDYSMEDLHTVSHKGIESNKEDYLHLSKPFRREFLKLHLNDDRDSLLKLNVVALRIMLKIISDLRNKTFISDKEDKRNVTNRQEFEKFIETETDYILSYKASDFVSNRDTNRLMKGLIWLTNYKRDIYTITTKTGKELKTFGGFLNRFWVDDSTGRFFVQVNNYWLEQLVNLSNSYSVVFINHLQEVKDIKKLIFLLTIAELKLENNLNYTLDNMNIYFDFKYKYLSQLVDSFIKPIKVVMDQPIHNAKVNQYSFNYRIEGNKITFYKYLIKPKAEKSLSNKVDRKTITKQQYHYKISYYKKRHNLSDEQITFLKKKLEPIKKADYYIERELYTAFNDAYKLFVKDCGTNKKLATDYIGEAFLSKIREFMSAESKQFI